MRRKQSIRIPGNYFEIAISANRQMADLMTLEGARSRPVAILLSVERMRELEALAREAAEFMERESE